MRTLVAVVLLTTLAAGVPAQAGQTPFACYDDYVVALGFVFDGCAYIGNEYHYVLVPAPLVPHCVPGPDCLPEGYEERGAYVVSYGVWGVVLPDGPLECLGQPCAAYSAVGIMYRGDTDRRMEGIAVELANGQWVGVVTGNPW